MTIKILILLYTSKITLNIVKVLILLILLYTSKITLNIVNETEI